MAGVTDTIQYSSQHFHALMKSSNAAIIVMNSLGYICDMNQRAFELLDMDRGECLGCHFFDILDFSLNARGYVSLTESFHQQPMVVRTKKFKKAKFIFSLDVISSAESVFSAPDASREPSVAPEGAFFETLVTFYPPNDMTKADSAFSNGFDVSYTFDSIIKSSFAMREVERISKIAAKTASNVLIHGESGTGKELIAQAIHNASSRRNGPFVALNCGAIPQGLIESELFGYEGGTFTGARAGGQAGKFEMATGGTIFLDEIGDMPLNLQVILLRVLQSREIIRLGGKSPKKVDVRVIAATNANLKDGIANKTFRSDLFYRLNVFGIEVPPLRERKEDIPVLVRHFIPMINEKAGTRVQDVEQTVMDMLMAYDWPGNIRELENVLEWSVNMAEDPVISVRHLPSYFMQDFFSGSEPLERDVLISTLENAGGNVNRVSALLGIGRRSLYRKFEKYEIDPTSFRK